MATKARVAANPVRASLLWRVFGGNAANTSSAWSKRPCSVRMKAMSAACRCSVALCARHHSMTGSGGAAVAMVRSRQPVRAGETWSAGSLSIQSVRNGSASIPQGASSISSKSSPKALKSSVTRWQRNSISSSFGS